MTRSADLKKALEYWDEFMENMNRSSPIDYEESKQEQLARIKELEDNPEAWFKHYFASYYTSEPAPFHKEATKRILSNPEWYEVRAWSRELSKSVRTMMEVLYLTLVGHEEPQRVKSKRGRKTVIEESGRKGRTKKKNVMLASSSKDDATRLLLPYKAQLEKNERLIHDYGIQEKHGSWTESEFITRKGVAFRAIGAGGNPRGTRNEAIRPDVLLIDDFDTDEDCRNPETVKKKWEWLEKAFYATRSISNPLLVIFCGNIIAEDCCINKAIKMADHHDIINIRDKNGKSTWAQKNTEAMIDRALKPISYASQQGEYFNNPITEGKVFKSLHYKKMRPIKDYSFLVAYTDPSYKSGKKNDYKATALIGKWRDEYHVIKMYCAQTTTAAMLDWQYEIMKKYGGKVPIYFLIEWPSIDDTLKQEIKKANTRHGVTLPLRADERNKGDKYHRIESSLEPLNRDEQLWFNEEMKPSEHMKTTEAQFLALSPKSRAHDDAPDAVEGGVFFINSQTISDMGKIEGLMHIKHNPKRY
ncbi:MAG: hypothetical protein AAGA66_08380 [Bacteroidota bacterium]